MLGKRAKCCDTKLFCCGIFRCIVHGWPPSADIPLWGTSLWGFPGILVLKGTRVVALSTTGAEYLSGTEATKEAMGWSHSYQAWGLLSLNSTICDNQSINTLARDLEYHTRMKHTWSSEICHWDDGITSNRGFIAENILTNLFPETHTTSYVDGGPTNMRRCTGGCSINNKWEL